MRIVGLNIDKGRVAASIVEKGMRTTELKDSFSLAFASEAELNAILTEKAKDWAGNWIVSSIPGYRFSQRVVRFPFGDRKRIEKALPFEIEDSLPFSFDDVILDHLVLDRTDKGADKKQEQAVLALMLSKTVLQKHLELLASAGVDPQVVVPSYLGLYHIARSVPIEGVAVLIDGSDLCVKEGKNITVCRSFSATGGTGSLRHTLKSLGGDLSARVEKIVLLSPNEALRGELDGLGVAVEQVAPDFHGKKPADPISLGLALSDETNMRKGDLSYRIADQGVRRRRRTLIIAGTMAVMLAAANIGVKSYLVQSSYGRLDREIREIYRQTVPEAKLVGDPVRQLRTKLEEAKKKYGVLSTGTSALDVMKAVTEGVPKEVRASFQDFLLEGGVLKLQGEAASFESVDRMKAELQKSPLFAEIVVQDTRMGVDNKVKFRFEMKVKQEK